MSAGSTSEMKAIPRLSSWPLWGLFAAIALTETGAALLLFRDPSNQTAGVSRFIRQQLKDNNEQVQLGKLNDFEWDAVYVFGPYDSQKTVNAALGVEWPYPLLASLEASDSHCVLIFLRSTEVVAVARVDRSFCDLSELAVDPRRRIARAEAIFKLKQSAGGGLRAEPLKSD